MDAATQAAFDDLKTKLSGLDKIAEIETAVVDDRREHAKTTREHKEAIDRIEASLEGLPKKWQEDMKAHMDMAPKPKAEYAMQANEWIDMKSIKDEDYALHGIEPDLNKSVLRAQAEGNSFRKSFLSPYEKAEEVEKTIQAVDGVPGHAVMSGILWNKAIVGDPWVMADAMQLPMSAPQGKLVQASGIEFAAEGNSSLGATSFDNPSGALASVNINALTYTCRVMVPRNQEDDLTGTVAHIEQMIRRAYGKRRGALTTAAVQGAAKAANEVKTGTADTALTVANAMSKALELSTKVSDYWPMGGAYMMHPIDSVVLYEAIASKGGFALDPQTGLVRLSTWPIHVDHQAQGNSADDNHPDFFGSWNQALVQAQRGRLIIDRYMATIPGAISIYSQFRFVAAVQDDDAFGAITVGA